MTNDKTVTMSRELAPCPFCYPHAACDEYPTYLTHEIKESEAWCVHAPCCDFYGPLSTTEEEAIRKWNKRAAPVVERQEAVGIEGMPQYLILFDDTERPVETMFGEQIARKRYADISMSWNAHLFVKIDSNSRDAMFAKNNATVYTSPPELAELQAIISRLTADVETMRAKNNELNDTVERLKGGQGDPVAWIIQRGSIIEGMTGQRSVQLDRPSNECIRAHDVEPLFTSQPAPVSAESAPMQRFLRLIDYHGCVPDTEAREKVIARAALRAGILPGLVWFHYRVNREMDLDYQEFLKDLNQYLGDAWEHERFRLEKVKELNLQ